MKKMTKGAVITGLGVALLLGGGGTLAVWNAEESAKAGTIASGELDVSPGEGTWTIAGTETEVDIASYLVVPGDSLTYTQPLTVTLEGDSLTAVLSVTGGAENGVDGKSAFDQGEIAFSTPTLLDAEGNDLLEDSTLTSEELRGSQTLTASTTFTFSEEATGSMNAAIGLDSVNYHLKQQIPAGA